MGNDSNARPVLCFCVVLYGGLSVGEANSSFTGRNYVCVTRGTANLG